MRSKVFILIYDPQVDRLAMFSDDETIHLHCGDCIEVRRVDITEDTKEIWIPTRVEIDVSGDWYLTGLYKAGGIPYGLAVRK